MEHPLPWTSDMKTQVPFFAAEPSRIVIRDANGAPVVFVPVYDNMPDGQDNIENAQQRAQVILDGVNQTQSSQTSI